MNTARNTSSLDWKRRYQDLLEQQEKQQTRHKRKQSLLMDAIIHLIQFGRDLDTKADDKLLAMRGIVRQDSIKNVDLALVVEALECQLDKSLKDRKKQQNSISQQMSTLAKQVQGLVQHRELQKELNELKKVIARKPLKLANVADNLGSLSDIHTRALKQFKSSNGILKRWFGINDAAQDPSSQDPSSLDKGHSLSLDTISDYLKRLLQKIKPKREMQDHFVTASKVLESGLTVENMDQAIQLVTDVVLATISSDQLEMKRYLAQMNERLQEATAGLNISTSLLEEEITESQDFGTAMKQSAFDMRANVMAETDLSTLKACINQSLDQMMTLVEGRQSQGENIQSQLSEQLEALVSRAKTLELQGQNIELRVAEQRHRALTDNLTSLPNREAYEETAAKEVQRWQRYGRPLCLALCDIDLFKAVNDNYGHSAGDEVLRQLSSLLETSLRGTDFVARYGGEEFVILLPETDRDQAVQLMDNLRETIEHNPISWKKKTLSLTVLIGISNFKAKDILESAFTRADRALYQAKENGRNQVQFAMDEI